MARGAGGVFLREILCIFGFKNFVFCIFFENFPDLLCKKIRTSVTQVGQDCKSAPRSGSADNGAALRARPLAHLGRGRRFPQMKPWYAIVPHFGPIETPAADLISHCLTLSAELCWRVELSIKRRR